MMVNVIYLYIVPPTLHSTMSVDIRAFRCYIEIKYKYIMLMFIMFPMPENTLIIAYMFYAQHVDTSDKTFYIISFT